MSLAANPPTTIQQAAEAMTRAQMAEESPESVQPESSAPLEAAPESEPEDEQQLAEGEGETIEAEEPESEPDADSLEVSPESTQSEDAEAWTADDLVQALEGATLKIQASGQTLEVTPEDLVKSFQIKADQTKKYDAIAEQRRALEAESLQRHQAHEQRAQHLASQLDVAEQTITELWNSPELEEMRELAPGDWAAERQRIQEKYARIQQVRANAAQQYDQESQQQFQEHIRRESMVIEEKYPNWTTEYRAPVQKALAEIGVSGADRHLWGDSRFMLAMTELVQLRQQTATHKAASDDVAKLKKKLKSKGTPPKLLKPSKDKGPKAQKRARLETLRKRAEQAKGRNKVQAYAELMTQSQGHRRE